MHEPDTHTLTARIASGDTEAFGVFYDEWFDDVCVLAKQLTKRDEQFCLDLVQDVMLRVVRSIRPIEDADGVRRWLRVVVRSCAYDRFRREKREQARRRVKGELDAVGAAAASAADEQLVWLEHELRALPPEHRELVMMRYRFGWTLQQISDHVGTGLGTVHRRLERVLAGLRDRARAAGQEAPDE